MARGILLLAVLAGLDMLNQWELLGLRTVDPLRRIGGYWLPLFAFCLYAMIWMGWWLYRLLNLDVPPVTSEYPDIDRAWSQALEAWPRRHPPRRTRPCSWSWEASSSGEESLFHAAGIKAQVKQVPRDPAEPLHVTANREGIWVTCPGASVLGQQLLALGRGADGRGEVTLDTLSGESSRPLQDHGRWGRGRP